MKKLALILGLTLGSVFYTSNANANVWDDFVDWVEDVHAAHEQFWVDASKHVETCSTTAIWACHSDIRSNVSGGDAAGVYLPFVLPPGSNGKDQAAYDYLRKELANTVDQPVRNNVLKRVFKEFFPYGNPGGSGLPHPDDVRAAEERARLAREAAERRAHDFNPDPDSRLGDSRFPYSRPPIMPSIIGSLFPLSFNGYAWYQENNDRILEQEFGTFLISGYDFTEDLHGIGIFQYVKSNEKDIDLSLTRLQIGLDYDANINNYNLNSTINFSYTNTETNITEEDEFKAKIELKINF